MCTRLTAAGLLALACVLMPARAGAEDSPKTTRSTTYRVEFKKPSSTTWTARSTVFSTQSAASADAQRLYNVGYDVRVTRAETITLLRTQGGSPSPQPEKTTPSKKKTPPGPTTDRVVGGISVVSPSKAQQVFKLVANRPDIAFRYPTDGCYARAHLMGLQMQQMGLKPGKVWAFDDKAFVDRSAMPRLVALTDAHPKGFVAWKYHVAPVLKVQEQGGQVATYVLDPSLHKSPVPLATWQKRMMHPKVGFTPRLDVTVWGQPPRDGNGKRLPGSGYWPGEDPGDLTTEARKTMVMYKPHQGTDWLPGRREVASRGKDDANDLRAIPAKEFTEKDKLDLPASK
jgi:hypothetical protein